MNRRGKQARLLTGGLIGGLPVTTPGDEYWDDVSLLIRGDTLTDLSGNNTPVANNGAAAGDTSPVKFASGSMSFDGSNDYINAGSTDLLDLAGGDWTIEAWVYLPDLSPNYQMISCAGGPTLAFNNTDGLAWQFYIRTTTIHFAYNTASSYATVVGTHGMSINTWHHVAVSRNGSTFRLFVDGSQVASNTGTPSAPSATDRTLIGIGNNTSADPYKGNIEDFRITKGVARYTQNFTPPTKSLPTNAPIVGRRGVGTYDSGPASSFDYLVVAGGGAGGGSGGRGGGGGAGGMRTSWGTGATSQASGNSGGNQSLETPLSFVSGNSFAITVGRGGVLSGTQEDGDDGNNSVFGSITATGGGGGGGVPGVNGGDGVGNTGGSGGGGVASASNVTYSGGTASTPTQGFAGGNGRYSSGSYYSAGGGGGAGAAGGDGAFQPSGGDGGDGLQSSITGTLLYYAGGGAGSSTGTQGTAGQGGGGSAFNGTGSANTGGGGGGGSYTAAGGSGIIVVRWTGGTYSQSDLDNDLSATSNLTATYSTSNGDHIVTFTVTSTSSDGTGTWTPTFTGTLRTRGYLGAASAVGGMLTLYDRYVDRISANT